MGGGGTPLLRPVHPKGFLDAVEVGSMTSSFSFLLQGRAWRAAEEPARPSGAGGVEPGDRTAPLSAAGELLCLLYVCFLLIKMSFVIKNEMSRRKKIGNVWITAMDESRKSEQGEKSLGG